MEKSSKTAKIPNPGKSVSIEILNKLLQLGLISEEDSLFQSLLDEETQKNLDDLWSREYNRSSVSYVRIYSDGPLSELHNVRAHSIFHYLATRIDQNGRVTASSTVVSEALKIGRHAFFDNIALLEDNGFLMREKKQGILTTYWLNPELADCGKMMYHAEKTEQFFAALPQEARQRYQELKQQSEQEPGTGFSYRTTSPASALPPAKDSVPFADIDAPETFTSLTSALPTVPASAPHPSRDSVPFIDAFTDANQPNISQSDTDYS